MISYTTDDSITKSPIIRNAVGEEVQPFAGAGMESITSTENSDGTTTWEYVILVEGAGIQSFTLDDLDDQTIMNLGSFSFTVVNAAIEPSVVAPAGVERNTAFEVKVTVPAGNAMKLVLINESDRTVTSTLTSVDTKTVADGAIYT